MLEFLRNLQQQPKLSELKFVYFFAISSWGYFEMKREIDFKPEKRNDKNLKQQKISTYMGNSSTCLEIM